MTWREFRRWALRQYGVKLSGGATSSSKWLGGSERMGQILGLSEVGQGFRREYDTRHQRRLYTYLTLQKVWRTGPDDFTYTIPQWVWRMLDLAETATAGYLCANPKTGEVCQSAYPKLDWLGDGVMVVPVYRDVPISRYRDVGTS